MDPMRLIYLSLLLLAVGGWVLVEYRGRMGQALRAAAAWTLLFLGAVALYGMWGDLRRDILPMQEMTATGSLALPRASDGHYYAQLQIGGRVITVMADTGASSLVLSPRDARSIGIDPETLAYPGQAMTANGPVQTATVRLRDVALGPFQDDSIIAQVNRSDMDISLLGMDYLGRFSIRIEGGQMILSR